MQKTSRLFAIPTGPSVADPAWMVAAWELLENPRNVPEGQVGEHIQFTDYSEVKKFIAECELKQARSCGYGQAIDDVCGKFGVKTLMELYAIAEKHREEGAA